MTNNMYPVPSFKKYWHLTIYLLELFVSSFEIRVPKSKIYLKSPVYPTRSLSCDNHYPAFGVYHSHAWLFVFVLLYFACFVLFYQMNYASINNRQDCLHNFKLYISGILYLQSVNYFSLLLNVKDLSMLINIALTHSLQVLHSVPLFNIPQFIYFFIG